MDLIPGQYPFIDRTYDLSEMAFSEAPPDLEALFKATANENGIELIRDAPVKLTCQTGDIVDAVFMIFWPSTSDRIHVLVPRQFSKGRA